MKPPALPGIATIALIACAGCSNSSDASPTDTSCETVPPEQLEQCLTDRYFRVSEGTSRPSDCERPADSKIGKRKEIGLFKNASILDGEVIEEGQFLQGFYASYDLTFFTRTPPMRADITYALDGTIAEFEAAAEEAGIRPGSEPTENQTEKLNRAVNKIMFGKLRSLVESESNPPKDRVNVVVLESITSPDVGEPGEGVIAGLGLSPALFKDIAADDPHADLFDLIGLPDAFTPTLFVGHRDVVKLAANPDAIVAHEMGHALGLRHVPDSARGNLMTAKQSASERCMPVLSESQVAQLQAAADSIATPRESWQRLFHLRDRIVSSLVKRRPAR